MSKLSYKWQADGSEHVMELVKVLEPRASGSCLVADLIADPSKFGVDI